jgi:hypothetical protein
MVAGLGAKAWRGRSRIGAGGPIQLGRSCCTLVQKYEKVPVFPMVFVASAEVIRYT